MRVVAVLPCWNARDRLADVTSALRDQVSSLVAIDNGSDDGSAAWLRGQSFVQLIANEANEGFPRVVNQGIERALHMGADAVLLVNDDAYFAAGAVDALAAALVDDGRAASATAKMRYRARPHVLNGTGGAFDRDRGWAALRGAGEIDRGQYDDLKTADYPSGAASLLRSTALQSIGGLDERYYLYFEDADWGLRAADAGWRTRYVPDALVLHEGSAGTRSDPARRRYYNVRNRLLLAGRYASEIGRARAWAETAALLARQPLRWPTPWRRRDAEAVVAGVADHLAGRYGRGRRFG